MNHYYPPVSFYFSLSLTGQTGHTEASFKEVSGLNIEMETEEIVSSGLNSFQHPVPKPPKYSNLVLKRGLLAKDSPLVQWCNTILIVGNAIETKNIVVSLLNENGQPIKAWSFADAWPVKWEVSDFNLKGNELAIETLEFSYTYLQSIL